VELKWKNPATKDSERSSRRTSRATKLFGHREGVPRHRVGYAKVTLLLERLQVRRDHGSPCPQVADLHQQPYGTYTTVGTGTPAVPALSPKPSPGNLSECSSYSRNSGSTADGYKRCGSKSSSAPRHFQITHGQLYRHKAGPGEETPCFRAFCRSNGIKLEYTAPYSRTRLSVQTVLSRR